MTGAHRGVVNSAAEGFSLQQPKHRHAVGGAHEHLAVCDYGGDELVPCAELIAAARASIEGSAAPLKYRQEVISELQIIDRICGLARPEMKTVLPLVRRLVMVMGDFDPVAAEGLRAWVNENHTG